MPPAVPSTSATPHENLLADSFDVAQRSIASHPRAIAELKGLQSSMPHDVFAAQFIECVNHLLVVFKREPVIERCIEFTVRYLAEVSASDSTLLNTVFHHLFAVCSAKDKAVRFRACQIISNTLDALSEEAELDEDVCVLIETAMTTRIMDKVPVVRVQAIKAVTRLQDPTNINCPIVQAYIQRMSTDSSADVRIAALSQLTISKATLPYLLARTRDLKDVVRQQAYVVLAAKVDVRALSIAQRMKLLQDGLNDRSAIVQSACNDMLTKAWFTAVQQDAITLLRLLDVEGCTDTCFDAAKRLVEKVGKWYLSAKDFDVLDCEKVIFWRAVCDYYKSKKDSEMLEGLLLTSTDFASRIAACVEQLFVVDDVEERMQYLFVAIQLVKLASFGDVSDEIGRRNLWSVTSAVLTRAGLPIELYDALMELTTAIFPDENERIRTIVEIIADIKEPLEAKPTNISAEEQAQYELQVETLRNEILQALEQREQYSQVGNVAAVEAFTAHIEELENHRNAIIEYVQQQAEASSERVEKDDAETWLRCMTLAECLLKGCKVAITNPSLQTLITDFVLPAVQIAESNIRNLAFSCIGLCGLLDKQFAQSHLLLLLQVVQVDEDQLQITALRNIFDFVMLYGLDAFELTAEQMEQAKLSVLQVLGLYLDNDSEALQTIAVEGFAKLLLTQRLASPQILSRLAIAYFNPTTQDNIKLRQCLTVFFEAFSQGAGEQLSVVEEAFLPTLRTILKAPLESPLHAVKASIIADYFLALSTPKGEVLVPDWSVHTSMGIKLCNEILTSDADECKVLTKSLGSIAVEMASEADVKILTSLAEELVEFVDDRVSSKAVEKFALRTRAMAPDADARLVAKAKRAAKKADEQDEGDSESEDEPDSFPDHSNENVVAKKPAARQARSELKTKQETTEPSTKAVKSSSGAKAKTSKSVEAPVESAAPKRTSRTAATKAKSMISQLGAMLEEY